MAPLEIGEFFVVRILDESVERGAFQIVSHEKTFILRCQAVVEVLTDEDILFNGFDRQVLLTFVIAWIDTALEIFSLVIWIDDLIKERELVLLLCVEIHI